MRVITWNVNSIAIRIDRLLALLARHQPDVVCLQELKCEDVRFPLQAVQDNGYGAVTLGQKTYNGVGILFRKSTCGETLANVQHSFDDGVDDPMARFIGAEIGGVSVYSAYVPNGQSVGADKYFYKLNWLQRLRRYLDRAHAPTEQVLVTGDYNVAPDDRDVHDPAAWREKILCSTREREALRHVEDFGLKDVFRALHPNETQFTWWDYRMLGFQKNHGLRIDLGLASAPLLARATACTVDREERKGEKPSDHAPVVMDFR